GTEHGDGASPAAAAALPATGGRLAPTEITRIYAKAGRAVVSVQTGDGSGTGFVIDRDGTIVTNAHVVGDAAQVRVRFDDDGAPVAARVAGKDVSSDLAVLKVDPDAAAGVEPLALAESRSVQVGDAAIAIGFPLGLDRTATAGIVSGLERQIESPNGFSIDEVIQTDAPINPGNSGGPLLDARGRVIGVNSQIATAGGGGGSVGIGFAIPSDTVRAVVPKLEAGQAVAHAWLGVATAAAPSGGVQVGTVTAGGPAERAGLRVGDTVRTIDGKPVADPDTISQAVAAHQPGDRLEVEVARGGQTRTLQITLGTRPETAP
ncbi:MAG TPA: trypsin-like peptidase domain-containing protein, partial [Solirubrobacteraceae bacterium]